MARINVILLYFVLLISTTICYSQTTYDFVPREKVIFEDNFSKDTIGTFPSKWKILACDAEKKNLAIKSACKVDSDGTASALSIKAYALRTIEPNLPTDTYLNDSFTLEYDFHFIPGSEQNCVGVTFAIAENKQGCFTNHFTTFNGGLNRYELFFPRYVSIGPVFTASFDKYASHHLALSYKNGKIKYYIDQNCMIDIPACGFTPISFSLNLKGPVKVTNIRLATGRENNGLNKILTENKFTTHAINFDVNKSKIQPGSLAFISQLAQFLKANPTVKLEIDGHTDSDGDAAANIKLSQARADEVKKQLVAMGIDGARLTTKGFGASKPIKTNTTAESKAENRRVEFIRQ